MAFPDYGAEVVINIALPSGPDAAVVMHVERTTDADLAWLTAIGDEFASWINDPDGAATTIRTGMATNVNIDNVVVTSRGTVPQMQYVADVGQAGLSGGGTVPPETALVVSWYTDLIGKSYRGRNFWPGMADGVLETNGLWLNTHVVQTGAAFEALIDQIDAIPDNTHLAVYSRTLGVMSEITSAVVRSTPHHQKRRNPQVPEVRSQLLAIGDGLAAGTHSFGPPDGDTWVIRTLILRNSTGATNSATIRITYSTFVADLTSASVLNTGYLRSTEWWGVGSSAFLSAVLNGNGWDLAVFGYGLTGVSPVLTDDIT